MQSPIDREKTELLLVEWYDWSRGYRPDLDSPGCSPACRNSKSSRQWDSTADILREECGQMEMEAVQESYEAIHFHYQSAIGVEMRNRISRAKVWRSPFDKTYEEAIEKIMPEMRKRGLFD